MFKSIFLLILVTFLTLACAPSDSTSSSEDLLDVPLVVSKGPINSAPVPINQKIYLEFSEKLDVNTLSNATAYILDESNVSIGLYLSVDASKALFTPYEFLKPSSAYTIVVTTDVKDVLGRSLSQNYLHSFTTLADAVDNAPLAMRALKPEANVRDALVQTDILIDFNKNMSLEPQYSGGDYFLVKDAGGTPLSGRIEIFNSLLKFIPSSTLPYNEKISVELIATVKDMYENNFSSPLSWSFTTKPETSSPMVNQGFASLASLSLGKTSSVVRTIYNDDYESKIAVASQDAIAIYSVRYSETPGESIKPTFKRLHSYSLPSQINAMESFAQNYLLVGTMDNGLYSLKVANTGVSEVGNYVSAANVYGLSVGKNSANVTDRAYAVGPTLGLVIFDVDETSGSLTQAHSTGTGVVGLALDVVDAILHGVTGAIVRKVYVADYNGRVIVCDENGVKITHANLNASVKKLTFNEDAYGKTSLFAIGSSGKMQGVDFDGGVLSSSKRDLLGNVNDVASFVDSGSFISNLYFSNGVDGLVVASGAYVNSLVDTGGVVVSSDIVINDLVNNVFLVTLNADGNLRIFNALMDDRNPYLYTTPVDGGTLSEGGEVRLNITDSYLDASTISSSNFLFVNNSDGSIVPCSLNLISTGYVLKPDENLTRGDSYTLRIDGNVLDMLGNGLNAGADQNVSFTVN